MQSLQKNEILGIPNGLSKMSAKSMLKLSYNLVHLQSKSLGCKNVSKMPGNTNGYYLEVNEAAELKGQTSRLDQCIMWCYKHDCCCLSV